MCVLMSPVRAIPPVITKYMTAIEFLVPVSSRAIIHPQIASSVLLSPCFPSFLFSLPFYLILSVPLSLAPVSFQPPPLSPPLSLRVSLPFPPLPLSLSPSLPLFLSPSLPLSLSPSLPLSLSPSLPLSLSPSLPLSIMTKLSLGVTGTSSPRMHR